MVGRTNVGGGGSVSSAWAYICVNYPSGSVCTATNGTLTITAESTSGSYVFLIPEPIDVPEEWTVACTDGTRNKSLTVTLSEQYDMPVITLSYSLLPSEYQEVEYLESTTNGGQYIDIGEWVDQTTANEYDIVFMMRNDLTHAVCGLVQQAGNNYYGSTGLFYTPTFVGEASILAFAYRQTTYSDWVNASGVVSLNTKYTVKLNTANHKINVNGTDIGDALPTDSGEIRYNPYLFAQHFVGIFGNVAQNGGNTRIYSFVQKDNQTDEKSMDLVPCYRKADNVAGMYDMVSGTFLTNSGSGTFVVGADV